jgi:lysophospholipase L1-like esterase
VQGRISSNFVDALRQRLGSEGYRFVNAGVAGHEAFNVLTRLDTVIGHQPDYVVILVGTNDVTATLSPRIARLSRLTKRIPQPPSAEFYHDTMLQIVRTLKAKTSANIALASLPVLGEDLDSLANRRIREHNALLKEITSQEHASYLPVYERQEAYLRTLQQEPGRGFEDGLGLSLQLLVRHFLLRQSFDAISSQNGFVLLTDGMHLNSRGAAFITDEIETFLRAHT